MTTPAFYTVGYSARTLEEFVALLRAGGVAHVVDVRAMPRTRTNPQFNQASLAGEERDLRHGNASTRAKRRLPVFTKGLT